MAKQKLKKPNYLVSSSWSTKVGIGSGVTGLPTQMSIIGQSGAIGLLRHSGRGLHCPIANSASARSRQPIEDGESNPTDFRDEPQ